MVDRVSVRPYARLLTMLGDQLIKNEQVAVIELIKNAYDADADWVRVSFENFEENYSINDSSRIIIEDNGTGMTKSIIEKSWMSPATPIKFSQDGKERKSVHKQRIIQGEKGIGRYAMLKLGKTIQLTTRPDESFDEHETEYSLTFDLAAYDDNFIVGHQLEEQGLFLDELSFNLEANKPRVFVERDIKLKNRFFQGRINHHGTRIEISNLRGSWNATKIKNVVQSFVRFGNLFDSVFRDDKVEPDFEIGVFFNGKPYFEGDGADESKANDITLRNLFETSSVLRVTNGRYLSKEQKFVFALNGMEKELPIEDSWIKGMKVFKDRFYDKENEVYRDVTDCGNFEFDFYVFDFTARDSKFELSKDAKSVVKEHRIYLLRDGIRVFPYGDPDDDWLQIEVSRGTVRAGDFLSNDQVIGCVKISKFGNPHLRDKTNREGLIEDGYYTGDFICLLRSFLSYLRKDAYAKYLAGVKKKEEIDQYKKKIVEREIQSLKGHFKDNPQALALVTQLEKAYTVEYKYLESRALQTESLAAVGLSVETASHDIMLMLNRGVSELMDLYESSLTTNFDNKNVSQELQKLYGIFTYVKDKMKDMQLLFTSSKQRRRQIRVREILDKVLAIYKRTLSKKMISCNVTVLGSPLMAKCTDADLLQLLINLMDNSIYWLETKSSEKKIEILLDGNQGKLIFSDNGPGVHEEDVPYIFQPFYSGKGVEGRGLGLYISRKLMERNDYSIDLADVRDEKILSGANFVVNFIKQEEYEY